MLWSMINQSLLSTINWSIIEYSSAVDIDQSADRSISTALNIDCTTTTSCVLFSAVVVLTMPLLWLVLVVVATGWQQSIPAKFHCFDELLSAAPSLASSLFKAICQTHLNAFDKFIPSDLDILYQSFWHSCGYRVKVPAKSDDRRYGRIRVESRKSGIHFASS